MVVSVSAWLYQSPYGSIDAACVASLSLSIHVVMVGLVPTIHPTACSNIRGWLDPRDKPEDDSGNHLSQPEQLIA
jgi:hypothetical protein